MDRSKLAQLGERLKTGGAQMGRIVSGKVREILQAPTPESKMVDEATLETLEEPNWGMNLRICAMINSEEFNGSEIVKAIKKKISSKSVVSQRLSLDLLEACAMNCEKVFSELASEKVLEDMVRMIDNPETDQENRRKAFQLIRAWGESQDLAYLPVFHQTYMSLIGRDRPSDLEGENSPPVPYSLETYMHQEPIHAPETYPIPDTGVPGINDFSFSSNHPGMTVEEKKEHLVIARNSLELLSSILNSEVEPKPVKDDLTVSLVDKCKQSLSVIEGIVEGTTNDEEILFEALYLNDELQQLLSKYDELEAAQNSGAQQSGNADTSKNDMEAVQNPIKLSESFESDDESGETEAAHELLRKLPKKSNTPEANLAAGVNGHHETKIADCPKGEDAESARKMLNEEK
ncbi:hypothetical protein L6164_034408 [Bauhinia variegata]|uniref:Uncharacterized protein n=1 Tax=Bauhinia variegata TaxID=167791 RepID=A0ACB9KUX5_BAUVA|nr:hypothetical protein L6164_034408 [Bauhinia variegata]